MLFSGLCALVVAMGIGRFAYTPILPLMKAEAGLSDTLAGVLASANYAGYLIGALWSSRPAWLTRRTAAIRCSLALSCATTAAMGLTTNLPAWLVLRCASGIASAFVLILVSSVVLDRAARAGRLWWSGILYSGVGLGIALTGISVPFLAPAGWSASWLGLAVASAVLSVPAFVRFDEGPRAAHAAPATRDRPHPLQFWSLMIAYFGDGVGYVIPATFIVAILRATPQLAPIASSAWILVGVVAAPSPAVWGALALRFGRMPMLAFALVVLAAGVVAPVYARNVAGASFSAFALGATFMGITTLVNVEARSLFPHSSNHAIGRLTAAFGVGQIVGPLVVSEVAATGRSYDVALLVAGAVLAASVLTLAGGQLAATSFRR